MVEHDVSADALLNLRRRNKKRRWLLFTRALLDKLFSFIITARTTYTAASRHLSSDVLSCTLRRQDVVKIGTAMLRVFLIPPETARCPICGPNPEFIVIDGQALGYTDPDDAQPSWVDEECPVLDIPASKLCVVESPALRAAMTKVLRTSTALTGPPCDVLRAWHRDMVSLPRSTVQGAAAYLFFYFFPVDSIKTSAGHGPTEGCANGSEGSSLPSASLVLAGTLRGDSRAKSGTLTSLESAVRVGPDGEWTLGGNGAQVGKISETWRDRTGICSPNFSMYARMDDGVWLAALAFFRRCWLRPLPACSTAMTSERCA